jgi:hypothetical protein
LHDLVFANFTDLKSVPAASGLVTPNTYHPPLSIDVHLPHVTNNQNCEFTYRNFAAGNYTLLYNMISTYNWSGVYEAASIDVAIASLTETVRDNIEQANFSWL